MIALLCDVSIVNEKPWYDQEFLGTIIVILLFIVERILSYFNNKKKTKSTWYLSVIITPNIQYVLTFYSKSSSLIEDAIGELKRQHQSTRGVPPITIQKINEFKLLKENLELEFLNLIRSVSVVRMNQMINCVNRIDDIIVDALSSIDLSLVDESELRKEIHKNKSDFFALLFSEIE